MKTIIPTLALLLVSQLIYAQDVLNLQEFYKQFQTSKVQQGIINPMIAVEGSPHASIDFVAGTVITKSDIRYEQVPLRFNIYANEMEFKTADGSVFFLAMPEIINEILINGDKYVYVPYTYGGRLLRGYFRIAAAGKASLLIRQNINLKEAEPPAPYKEAQPARFIKMPDEYFVRIGEAEAVKISNRKELLTALSDKSSQMDLFIKKNKTKFNREEDLLQAIKYYNQLD